LDFREMAYLGRIQLKQEETDAGYTKKQKTRERDNTTHIITSSHSLKNS